MSTPHHSDAPRSVVGDDVAFVDASDATVEEVAAEIGRLAARLPSGAVISVHAAEPELIDDLEAWGLANPVVELLVRLPEAEGVGAALRVR